MMSGHSPRRRLSTEQRRAELLRAARRLYATGAYKEITVEQVAEAAGVSESLVFHYFNTKAALYGAVIEDLLEGYLHRQRSGARELPQNTPATTRIQLSLHSLLDGVSAYPRVWAAPFSGAEEPPAVGTIRRGMRQMYVDMVAETLELPDTPAHRHVLWGFLAYCEQQAAVWVERECPEEDREMLVATAIGALMGALGAIDEQRQPV